MISSELAKIPSGNIEYSQVGEGPAVLVSHGTLGGFDQGLAIAGLFDQHKFSYLAVSRAGYLRSSSETGKTPNAQARSFVELLDQLGLDQVAMLGLSGGAPAAIAYTELFPDRCWALVLLSSISTTPPPLPPFFRFAVATQDYMLRFDFLWRLVYRVGLRQLIRSNGANPEQVAQILADPKYRQIVRGIFNPIQTSSLRRRGVRLDDVQLQALPAKRTLTTDHPVYIAHAANDPLAPVSSAASLTGGNPRVEYHEYPDGGHLFFVVHNSQLVPDIERFMQVNAPEENRA